MSGTWNSGSNTSVQIRLVTDGGINGNVWFENIRLIPQGGASVPALTRTYYHAGAQSVAVRVAGDPNAANNTLFFLLGDHLGSTSKTVTTGAAVFAELRYKPWGETRYSSGHTPTEKK